MALRSLSSTVGIESGKEVHVILLKPLDLILQLRRVREYEEVRH